MTNEINAKRHPSTESLMRYLRPNPNLPVLQHDIAEECFNMSLYMLNRVPQDGPELTAGLRKLLEAKDCFVRASLDLDPVDYKDR